MLTNHLLFMDTETGGVSTEFDLLTAYFLLTDSDLKPIDELELKVNSGYGYRVTAEALGINKINLVEHDKIAEKYGEAGVRLYNFLAFHASVVNGLYTPAGHNVHFDITHVVYRLLNEKRWGKFVSYRCLDTQSVAQFLIWSNKLPFESTGSLSSLAKGFGIVQDLSGQHDAKYDVLLTIEVLKCLRKLM